MGKGATYESEAVTDETRTEAEASDLGVCFRPIEPLRVNLNRELDPDEMAGMTEVDVVVGANHLERSSKSSMSSSFSFPLRSSGNGDDDEEEDEEEENDSSSMASVALLAETRVGDDDDGDGREEGEEEEGELEFWARIMSSGET